MVSEIVLRTVKSKQNFDEICCADEIKSTHRRSDFIRKK